MVAEINIPAGKVEFTDAADRLLRNRDGDLCNALPFLAKHRRGEWDETPEALRHKNLAEWEMSPAGAVIVTRWTYQGVTFVILSIRSLDLTAFMLEAEWMAPDDDGSEPPR